MATHSSILAWEIPWTEEPGRLQSIWWQRVGYDQVRTHMQFLDVNWEIGKFQMIKAYLKNNYTNTSHC